eukprot:g7046.t1
MYQAARSSFASFEAHERNTKGINGALTPARHRRQKNTNDLFHPASTSTPNPTPSYPRDQTPGRLRLRQERLVDGEGISLQETGARIDELERGEFDLKLKLFYMEEQLAAATNGDNDVLHLHKEVIDAKLHRSQAEVKARAAGAALSELEAKCSELETQIRDGEEQRKKDRENWAVLEGENEARLKKHAYLLEDALRTERAENARLRLAIANDSRRGGSDGGRQLSRTAARRRSTGDDSRGQPLDPWRGSGGSVCGFGREQRDQQQQLTAKIRSQDSSLRALRADVTTLRKRMTKQAETLAQQKEENATVRRAAEHVACVEAEEIARLAVDLERAVRAGKVEAAKRRHVEERLAAAEACLLDWETGALQARSSHTKRSRSPVRSPRATGGRTLGPGESGESGERDGARGRSADFPRFQANPGEDGSKFKESSSLPPPSRGALGSTIASRGRCVHRRPATESTGYPGGLKGMGRASFSPRRSKNAETKGQRRPWGSSPPPSHRRKGDEPGVTGGATSRRWPLVDGGGSSAERKRHQRRHSEERIPAGRAFAGRGGKSGNPPARQSTAEELPGRESRQGHASAGGQEAGSLSSSTEQRAGTKEAPAAQANVATEARRERPPSDRAQGMPVAEKGAVAAFRGVDLTAKIAQELRAAVATTPASAVSPRYFSDGSSGRNTPSGAGSGGGGRGGDDGRGDNTLGCLEGGDLLKSIWQGTSQYALDGDKRKPIAAMRSREVSELESDVQHIFQFFAAKDGRKRSGIGAADGGKSREAGFLPE